MVLSLRVKYGIQWNLGSRDTGPLGTPKRLFRLFLEKYHTDFEDFLPEGG